ncbi:MAG: D-2-hydroxyacid dehydrogenase [Bryobacterales bacterium]|nr:D-2-hydroxyacid dehydrogenase [Bryobacteraceae bacterium]MDW8355315.1 D-2-hydroxyacid dehydrogenase [Bryobacterales bacterium]
MLRFFFSVLCLALPASAQPKKILVFHPDPTLLRELEGVTPQAQLVPVTAETVMREIADADAFIGNIRPEHVRAGKKLKWVQVMSAGVEQVLHLSGSNDLRDSDIVLTNNKIVQGPEIADHAMALLLALARRIPEFVENRRQEIWRTGRPYEGIELNGRTALVIGVGGVGMQIAVRSWACGMTVLGADPEDIPYTPFLQRVVKPDQLDEVLPQADVIFVAAPHTPESYKMLGPRQFERMKPGAYFIAVSRGALYDMDALVKALDSRRLAGAGLDVTDPEPLPKGHPLWKFDNVIITPHIAGRSDKDRARMIGTVRENIRRFVEGKPLINIVDKHKGY